MKATVTFMANQYKLSSAGTTQDQSSMPDEEQPSVASQGTGVVEAPADIQGPRLTIGKSAEERETDEVRSTAVTTKSSFNQKLESVKQLNNVQ